MVGKGLSFTLIIALLTGAFGATDQNVSTIAGIIDTCYQFLESHLCEGTKWDLPYHFYRPSIDKYSADQWLWDSGSHMIVWTHRNMTNAILDLRTMLQFQQPDGRIPEQIFWQDRTPLEEASILKYYSNTKITDLTQMPVLPYSVRSMYNQTHDKAIIKEFLYPLVNYFKWWRSARDLGDGLIMVIQNWETGIDASPAYDPAFHVYITTLNQSAYDELYPKFHQVLYTYKFYYGWNQSTIMHDKQEPDIKGDSQNWFKMKDLALNCIYASGWGVLADLADEIGDTATAQYCRDQYTISENAILKKMYIPEQGHFQSLYIDTDGVEKVSQANTIQNLFPLLLKNLPQEKLDLIVSQLKDETKFNAKFSVPTVAMDDPQFSATFDVNLMWRGPVWGFTNWFLMEGLALHNQFDLQAQILNKWIDLVKLSGIWEHYNPLNGDPYGPEGLGMSTLICDYIQRYGLHD